jgi:hypothetical protein
MCRSFEELEELIWLTVLERRGMEFHVVQSPEEYVMMNLNEFT